MVIGGLAVIARGVPRHTDDLDVTVWAADTSLAQAYAWLTRAGFESRIPNPMDFARQNQIFLLEHPGSGTSVDLSLAWLPFEAEALAEAEMLSLRGVKVPVARVEDLIIYKLLAFRDRDRADVEHLLDLHAEALDLVRGGAWWRSSLKRWSNPTGYANASSCWPAPRDVDSRTELRVLSSEQISVGAAAKAQVVPLGVPRPAAPRVAAHG